MNPIKAARLAKGLTAEQLAALAGLTGRNRAVTVFKWESGVAHPHPLRWKAIAKALGTTVKSLFGGEA